MKQSLGPFFLTLLIPISIWAAGITDIRIEGEIKTTTKDRILKVLPYRVGDPADSSKLELGEYYLSQWGIFSQVTTRQVPNPKGVSVIIDIQEAKIISEISIRGGYPYVSSKIRKRLNLQVGDMLLPETIEEQIDRIKRFYERKGYFNTAVYTETEPAAAKNSVRLIFNIKKGDRLRYGKIEFLGVKRFLVGRMHTFIPHMNIYSEKRLKEALKRIVHFYRKKGFLKAKVKVIDKKINWKRLKVDLMIEITEGPQVAILFRGNPPYPLSILKETVTLYEEGNFDSVELQFSTDALLKKLREDGYKEAKAAFTRQKIDPNHYHIIFFIYPGPRSYIYSIQFDGNKSFSDGKLSKQMFTKKHSITQRGILKEVLLAEDRKVLESFYRSQGFVDIKIPPFEIQLSETRWRYDIDIGVFEGPKVLVEAIQFNGNGSFKEEEILKRLTNIKGEPVNETYLPLDLEQVELFYADHGHPYVEVDQEVVREGNRVRILYHIIEGPAVTIGDIFYVGDVLTGVRALRQTIQIHPGDPYSRQKIIQAGLNLRRLGAFTAVDVDTIGLEAKKEAVFLRVKVEERPPFVIDLDAQYSTDTRYSGTVKFTNYNSFGWAKQTRLLFVGGIEKDRAELSWLDPRFLGTDIQMTVASWMDYEKEPTETSLQTGGSASFFRIFKRFGFLGRYQITRNYIFSGQSRDPASLRDSTLSEIDLSASYNTRNSFADPTKGYFILTGAQLFTEIGGLNANFIKLKLSGSHYVTPHPRFTWTNTLRLNRIQDIGDSASVPQRELLVLGGDDTVRGFKEDRIGPLNATGNPLGGRVRIIYNSEFHIRLANTFQLGLFYDTGALTNSFPEIRTQQLRHAAGFGLRYITPVGPIRADYGIILDRRAGEDFGRFHLTFGYPL